MGETRPPRPDPLPFDPEPVPDELRDHDQWVCWRYSMNTDRDDWTKVPIDPSTGHRGKSNDPDTWTSFEDAVEYHNRADTNTDGVGFVVHDDDLFVGIDLDDCRDPDSGDCEPWASDLVEDVPTYTEVSPSGTGLHLFGLGILPDEGNRADIDGVDGHLEMYDNGRYLTVTGHHVDETPTEVRKVPDEIAAVHAAHIADDTDETLQQKTFDSSEQASRAGSTPEINNSMSGSQSGGDEELIEKAKNAENGGYFTDLWEGRWEGHTGRWDNDSHSEARMALIGQLAFWTGRDRAQMRRLFKQSTLAQQQLDKAMRDFDDHAADKVLRGTTDYYDPDDDGRALPNTPGGGVDYNRREMDVTLCPAEVAGWAGLGEAKSVADLTDRQKAACVWDLLDYTDRYHVRVRRDNGSLWAYDDGVWISDGERALRHAGREALGPMNYGQNVLTELKTQARGDPSVEVEPDAFGLKPGMLAVENGLVDLNAAADGTSADAIRDLRPDDYALAQLPVEYGPDATADNWAGYVEEWAENGRADALQEYVGYCLHIGAMPIHRALLLVGSGANGKGTFLHVIRALLGRENTSSIELQTLANERDAVADFYGSLANIDDDLSARKLGQGKGTFKKLVGGDRVRGRHLYEDSFEFDATGKHLYAANEVPDVKVPDNDEAFWRRWLLVEFPNHYPPSERDPGLRDELTTDDTLSGVLNWAINGWRRLLDQGQFTNEDHYAQAKRERWQAWGESVNEFISKCVDHDPDANRLTTADAHRRYKAWCREHGLDPVGQREFTNTLKDENVGYKTSIRIDGESQRGYKDLGLSDDVPDLDDTPERTDSCDARQASLF